MSNSWEYFEDVKEKLSKIDLEIEGTIIEWGSGQIQFKCHSNLTLKKLQQLSDMFEARTITIKPEFDYRGPWNWITIEVNIPGRSNR